MTAWPFVREKIFSDEGSAVCAAVGYLNLSVPPVIAAPLWSRLPVPETGDVCSLSALQFVSAAFPHFFRGAVDSRLGSAPSLNQRNELGLLNAMNGS